MIDAEHARAEDQSLDVHTVAVAGGPRIELRHPQSCQRGHQPADADYAARGPVPGAMAATKAR